MSAHCVAPLCKSTARSKPGSSVAVSLSISTAGSESARRLASLLTRSMDPGQEAANRHGHTAGNPFSKQAGNCLATDSQPPGARDPRGSHFGRRCLWQRHEVSRGHHRIGVAICDGHPVVGERVVAQPGADAQAEWKGIGRPTQLLRRSDKHVPVAVRALAMSLPASAWKTVGWQEGTRRPLRSRFAALGMRPAHRDRWSSELPPEQ